MPTVSSRTPEGSPGKCPACGKDVLLEVSQPFGDAPCPHCGTLLRFIKVAGDLRLFDDAGERALRRKLRIWIATQLGVEPHTIGDEWEALRQLDADSLEIVELAMEIEENFDDRDDP